MVAKCIPVGGRWAHINVKLHFYLSEEQAILCRIFLVTRWTFLNRNVWPFKILLDILSDDKGALRWIFRQFVGHFRKNLAYSEKATEMIGPISLFSPKSGFS